MGLAGIFGLERIEDPALGVVDLEGVPRKGARLRYRQCPAGFEECSEFAAFVRLGLE
jgi:hypothetical protein